MWAKIGHFFPPCLSLAHPLAQLKLLVSSGRADKCNANAFVFEEVGNLDIGNQFITMFGEERVSAVPSWSLEDTHD